MVSQDSHLSDQELLLALDGELSVHDADRVQIHLTGCWRCRVRKQEMETAIAGFIRMHHESHDLKSPFPDGRRALLKAQLAQIVHAQPVSKPNPFRSVSRRLSWAMVPALMGLCLIAYVGFREMLERRSGQFVEVAVPNPRFTPGATVLFSRGQVCSGSNAKNRLVPSAVQRKVFDEYGIQAAEPNAYEVDYLITPALGGADDIHNLWPQSRKATVWNSLVKDQLEDRMRNLVCDGQLDLATAQREIASNWIDAYKKYFRTDQPLNRN